MVSNKKYQSSKLSQKKKKTFYIKLILTTLLIIGLLFGISAFSKYSKLQISNILVKGNRQISSDEIESLAREKIEGNYGRFLLSKSNIFLYPKFSIEKNLFNRFSSIEEIDIDFENLNSISIEVKEYEPIALWCGDICYLVNGKGKIFIEEPLINNNQFIKFYGGIEGDPLRQDYISEKVFNDLMHFSILLRRLDITATSITTDDSRNFTVKTKAGANILIESDDDVLLTFDNLQTVITQDAINKAQFGNIDYIDLRAGNKVFYKLK